MEMKVNLNKWGNSVAVRIPHSFIKQLGLQKDTSMEMSLENDKIVLTRKRFTLDHLLAGINSKNTHQETKTGKNLGKEIW